MKMSSLVTVKHHRKLHLQFPKVFISVSGCVCVRVCCSRCQIVCVCVCVCVCVLQEVSGCVLTPLVKEAADTAGLLAAPTTTWDNCRRHEGHKH